MDSKIIANYSKEKKIRNDNNNDISVTVVSKSSNTLKNNINSKDEIQRKRTSLQIIPHNPTTSLSNNAADDDDLMTTASSSTTALLAESNINNNESFLLLSDSTANNKNDLDEIIEQKNINRYSITSDNSSISERSLISIATTTESSSASGGGNFITSETYYDLEKKKNIEGRGIKIDSKLKKHSSISSSTEYILKEKLHSLVNESQIIIKQSNVDTNNPNICDSLLSPHEGPLGRRYAEIAQFKNPKWSTETSSSSVTQQFVKSGRLPFSEIDSSGNLERINKFLSDNNNTNKIDVTKDTSCDDILEDDMQALLPNCRPLSVDELSQSRVSLISSSDGGILAEGETSSETSVCSDSPPCDLGLVERLLRTHPVWFLPGIQRAGAVHLLQGKEEGNFIVRGSSQPNTMAVSVRLPIGMGPYIEHYLIQSNLGILSLESSRFKFDSIPALIAHYAQCCDELPVQLVLARTLNEAKNRQQLSSLALLGQEFWRYPLGNTNPMIETTEIKSPNSFSDSNTSGIGMTIFSSSNEKDNCNQNQIAKLFSPTNPLGGLFSQAGTPSDTNSSLSSFTTSTGQNYLVSPESIDNVILTMSPVETPTLRNAPIGIPNKLSTFKSMAHPSQIQSRPPKQSNIEHIIRSQRPTPPNTLNLGSLRIPPAPPTRWAKPVTPINPTVSTPQEHHVSSNNFTVTTTVTFKVDNSQFVEVTSPTPTNQAISTPNSFHPFSKRLSPEGECKTQIDTLSSQGSSNRWQSQNSKDSNKSQKKIFSPTGSNGTPSSGKQKRIKERKKESKHYQESDILDSPQIYCRSALGDKISDYEDLWTQDNQFERNGVMSSFKPEVSIVKRPDLLQQMPHITSLNCNLLSPTGSISSPSINTSPTINVSSENNSCYLNSQEHNSDTEKLISTEDVTKIVRKNYEKSNEEPIKKNRLGLFLPLNDNIIRCENELTPIELTPTRSKQGSPFYAEPADALRQAGLNAAILRRMHRNNVLPANHRHSEPPKGGACSHICPALVSSEIEKIAGSLDHLKNTVTKTTRTRLDPWPVDSSWEFMIRNDEEDEYGDYDSEENWSSNNIQIKPNSEIKEIKKKPITIHQIIANKLPELNLPEIVRCSTPLKYNQLTKKYKNDLESGVFDKTIIGDYRVSSYDNVEKTTSLAPSFLSAIDSGQSDDGTVFSEPWDSSQWDSFLPHDDTTSDTIHLSKCQPALFNSEDDTLIEDSSIKDNQGTLKANKNQRPKIATITRNRSCRDREILCHPRNKINQLGGPGESIRLYALLLAKDSNSTFARNIENFISCTKESRESAPQIVMRNMRQFMNGMKNYLVKHGEGDFQQKVEKARSQLKPDEFLNLDRILETVMHKLVVLPLREYLYGLFVDYYTRSNDIQLLAENVKYACSRKAADFGIPHIVEPPSIIALQRISTILLRLYEAELPLDKLDHFLTVITIIIESSNTQQVGADELLPLLVYVVAKCGFVGAEIEAEFMWGLLQPQLLNGEPGYYLTSLCSAVHVLKTFMSSTNGEGSGSIDWRSSSMPACSSVLRVIIPDEYNGSLHSRTLPVRPHTTTREVCRIIAHKARITNPQDYALFKLVDGEETLLNDSECPQDIRISARGKHCMLAYKRIDAKIAWPTTTPN